MHGHARASVKDWRSGPQHVLNSQNVGWKIQPIHESVLILLASVGQPQTNVAVTHFAVKAH